MMQTRKAMIKRAHSYHKRPTKSSSGFRHHLNPRARGRTRPLVLPRPVPPRPLDEAPPRDGPGTRDCRESGAANFLGVGLEAVGGFSTKDMSAYFGEVDAKGIHIQAVEETRKALAKASQALVHQLEVHHVGLEVGDGIRELGECGLEGVQREGLVAVDAALGGLAEGGA
ncbi:hypothetical protein NPX13_g11144 [Xylaria arbuscula]|uniref:Uncharacterized protein n=1 Tax=Xylaria arbuscula TaxID=114810 RepID=A0A9W8N3C8_9PEZI|nr:hypothetical protein NPX13_g11144 [Xylaria arbuscula]